jgi:hypothetical protein
MSVAKSAELLQLDAIGVRPLVLAGRVVPLLAIRAGERNENPHPVHLPEVLLASSTESGASGWRGAFRPFRKQRGPERHGSVSHSYLRGAHANRVRHDNETWRFAANRSLYIRRHFNVTKII